MAAQTRSMSPSAYAWRASPAVPLVVWTVLFLIVPAVMLLLFSFWRTQNYSIVYDWTLKNYAQILSTPSYMWVFARTFFVAAAATVIAIIVGYPVALYLARAAGRWKGLLIAVLIAPLWTNLLIRNYAWLTILGDRGLINYILLSLGIIDAPLQLSYNVGAVIVAAVYLQFPFAVLVMYTSLIAIGNEIFEAGQDLGAKPWEIFTRLTFPLSWSGVQLAVIFVFVPTLGLFVTPAFLGGSGGTMVGNLTVTFFDALSFPLGSAMVVSILVVALVVVWLFGRSQDLERVYAGGTGLRKEGKPVKAGIALRAFVIIVYIFLCLPPAMVIISSFNPDRSLSFPPTGFTERWYVQLFENARVTEALGTSLFVAVMCAIVAVIVVTPAAYSVARGRVPGGGSLRHLMVLALMVPPLLTGFGMLLLFSRAGVTLSLVTVIVGHVSYVLPYVFLVMLAQQFSVDKNLESAANDLGATPFQAFMRVSLPLMRPGMAASAILAFTLSLDEFVITFLVSGSDQTLPLYIWGQMRTESSPVVVAVGSFMVIVPLAIVLTWELLVRPRINPAAGPGPVTSTRDHAPTKAG